MTDWIDLRGFVVGICSLCNPRMVDQDTTQLFLFELTDRNRNNELDVDEVIVDVCVWATTELWSVYRSPRH